MINDENRWITIDPKSKLIILRFRVKGFDKQFRLTTGLRGTKPNIEKVRSLREKIENDIFFGEFDETLVKYKAVKSKSTQKLETIKDQLSLPELWEKFVEFKSSQLEETTIRGTYSQIARYIDKLPTDDLSKASLVRDWLLSNLSHHMAWINLRYYRACCDWALKSGLINSNPFDGLSISRPKKKSTDDDYPAFTLEQRDIITNAFENHPKYSHYTSLIKFLFWTGCRHGEAFALTWGDISPDCLQIHINKSRNSYKILKGTKNGKRRTFPVSPQSKLHNLLLNIKPKHPKQQQTIFLALNQNKMDSYTLANIWKGYITVYKETKKFYPGVVTELVNENKLPFYLKPYSTRHTFATWAITTGISPDKVALWIGDDVQTVLRFYCHPNVVSSTCPDF